VNCGEYLDRYGGHEMAVGLSIQKKNFEKFKKEFEKKTEPLTEEDLTPILYVDEVITHKDVTIDNIKQLDLLQPFGEANSMPLFVYKNMKVNSISSLTEGKHLKLTLKDGNNLYDAIGFNMGALVYSIKIGDNVDVLTYLTINDFNNKEKIQFSLKDIKISY